MRDQTREKPTSADKNETPHRDPAGRARPNFDGPDPRAEGVEKPRDVEERPFVGSVRPGDYPEGERAKG
ncbi:hypothetical protein ACFOMD_00800 [Sphingoaurantiacus capsulatus]|uniref:Uncharacterized protein n=1 Tax=Sphingoaurantiacus capsulatus TaxID=1771310 RepID=A0ABV7X529_9SPHN